MSVLLLSGGLDSLVLLADQCRGGAPPLCVSFDYGQRHRRELDHAELIAASYGAPWRLVRFPGVLGGSALTGGGDVPKAHYADPIQAATVVPNRNMVFLSLAASMAVQDGRGSVLFAAHAGDAAVYPDCRREFVSAADRALRLACGVGVAAPFLAMTKRDVVRLGRELGVSADLAWSCYEGGETPCGACGACVERKEAMQ